MRLKSQSTARGTAPENKNEQSETISTEHTNVSNTSETQFKVPEPPHTREEPTPTNPAPLDMSASSETSGFSEIFASDNFSTIDLTQLLEGIKTNTLSPITNTPTVEPTGKPKGKWKQGCSIKNVKTAPVQEPSEQMKELRNIINTQDSLSQKYVNSMLQKY